jgi:hypothetical protein
MERVESSVGSPVVDIRALCGAADGDARRNLTGYSVRPLKQ